MKYYVIRSSDLTDLMKWVSRYINEGWKPQGGVSFAASDKSKHFLQAMIKE